MSNQTVTFSHDEVVHLVDALTKGAARHSSYAKFYPRSAAQEKHIKAAASMTQLLMRLKRVERNTRD